MLSDLEIEQPIEQRWNQHGRGFEKLQHFPVDDRHDAFERLHHRGKAVLRRRKRQHKVSHVLERVLDVVPARESGHRHVLLAAGQRQCVDLLTGPRFQPPSYSDPTLLRIS